MLLKSYHYLQQFQLCRSVEEDDVKNTLLKFGLVTHLYDEVSKFRKAMKSLQDLTPKSKKKKKTGPAHIARADKVVGSAFSYLPCHHFTDMHVMQ